MTKITACVIVLSAALAGSPSLAEELFSGNQFCGPQCVQRVLEYYGMDEDLIPIIKEIQWPDPERGSSFDDLARALKRRELYTAAINLQPGDAFHWRSPAIVQLKYNISKHYVVWLPPEHGAPARIWDPLQSNMLEFHSFERLRTGSVLLTSQTPISPASAVGETRASPVPFPWQCVIVGSVAVCLGFLLAETRRGPGPAAVNTTLGELPMTNVARGCLGVLATRACISFTSRTVPATLLVANAQAPPEALLKIIAYGNDCPTLEENYRCNPEKEECKSNACTGNAHNPYADCEANCVTVCLGEPNEYACYMSCMEDCWDLPTFLIKDCSAGPIDNNETPTDEGPFDRWRLTETSTYESLSHEM